jgi:hypothetical protein
MLLRFFVLTLLFLHKNKDTYSQLFLFLLYTKLPQCLPNFRHKKAGIKVFDANNDLISAEWPCAGGLPL